MDRCERPAICVDGLCAKHYGQLPDQQAKDKARRQTEAVREKRRVIDRKRSQTQRRKDYLSAQRGTHTERAERYGVEWARFPSRTIFERDGYICQICKRKTKGKWPAPRSPTLDHIIPLSKGGPHLPYNCQTACAECNVRKNNGAADDQLRLAI